ncbi:hypothetical protein K402DRAFT_431269 [Aulographum hederae CBS 113979]|uniref:N-acetylglucosamine-induced protein 1 n=1 Tax=Aulographum hederae CBS 113979 TaxID=1176131 RepID=A0A6G1GZF9_9PEZI|nr:hypothetical protein K402DRAFT_431269 [Aulographum hederae CBS 113979]
MASDTASPINIAELIRNPPFELSKADREALLTPEEDFIPHSWEDLKQVIAAGDLSLLKRTPTSLRDYILWTRDVRQTYGSVMNCILQERLGWEGEESAETLSSGSGSGFVCANLTPFEDERDYRVLRNDWPYGFEEGMVHLVIWVKRLGEVDGEGGLTKKGREEVEGFLDVGGGKGGGVAKEDLLWFRNSRKWQSVQALEHIHVVVRNVAEGWVERLTGQRAEDCFWRSYVPK